MSMTQVESRKRKRFVQSNAAPAEETTSGKQPNLATVPDRPADKKLNSRLKRTQKRHKNAAMEAALSQILLPQGSGFIEVEGPMEQTWKLKQDEIKRLVDVQMASESFSLTSPELGPYRARYTRNGRYMLLGGQRGHVAMIDSLKKVVVTELNLRESIRDVTFLHNEGMFAVAQEKYLYVYDKDGLELHCMKQHLLPSRLEFLPYHFLLVSVGRAGYVKWHDVSTGRLVAEFPTRRGLCQAMCQNPINASVHLGHGNGLVSIWSPVMSTPLVSMLCHRGPVNAISVDLEGRYMATAGMDGRVAIRDLRTYKQLHAYQFATAISTLDISQRGLLAVGCGYRVTIWKDALCNKASSPYLTHEIPGRRIHALHFRPYHDILGIGHQSGFVSIIVPGAGEPNFDALEANPFQTRKQRREAEVHELLDKLQPETIALKPRNTAIVDQQTQELVREQRLLADEADKRPRKQKKEKHKARGRDKLNKRLRRKQKNVIDEKTQLRRLKVEQQREETRQSREAQARRKQAELAPKALQRFFS